MKVHKVADVAKILGITEQTVRQRIRSTGMKRYYGPDGHLRVRPEDVRVLRLVGRPRKSPR